MPEETGLTDQSLWLRSTIDGTLLNAAGDLLTEAPASSGRFTATVAETHAALQAAVVLRGGLAIRDGWLVVDEIVVRDAYPSVGGGGGGGGTDWDATERAQIRFRLGMNGTATAPTPPVPAPIVITPGTGNQTTAFLTCLTAALVAEAGVTVSQEFLQTGVGETGLAYSGATARTFTSSGVGIVEMPCIKGATYRFWRGTSQTGGIVVTIPIDAGATFALPSLIGR